MIQILLFLILLFLIFKLFNNFHYEGLTSRPNIKQLDGMINDVINNKDIFSNGNVSNAKKQISWMDVIVFEDVRNLIRTNTFNKNNVSKILN